MYKGLEDLKYHVLWADTIRAYHSSLRLILQNCITSNKKVTPEHYKETSFSTKYACYTMIVEHLLRL